MKVTENPSLQAMNTFGVSATASLLLEVENEEDVLSVPLFDPARDLVLGGGSNILFVSDVPGTVFLNRIGGIEIIDEDESQAVIEVGAGENWHGLVTWSVRRGLCGLENLALIPGLVGAAPIQNIGAYGIELSSVLESVTAWDWQRASWVSFNNEQCGFSYRNSRFRSEQSGRYFITSIRLRLAKNFTAALDYPGLKAALATEAIRHPCASDVYAAVMRLRKEKLPDPAVEGNAGSFFKNPVISTEQLESLHVSFPALPAWTMSDKMAKISAAWMIEHCGLKGHRYQGAAVSTLHALVLLNQNNATGRDIWQLAQHVQQVVQKQFGVTLEPEPNIYLKSART